MGLNFGEGSEELNMDEDEDVEHEDVRLFVARMTVIIFTNDFPAQPPERPLEYPDSDVDEAIHTPPPRQTSRIWTVHDRVDLAKLSSMISHFLKTAPFISAPKLFGTLVSAPLMGRTGPRPGSIQVLKQIMQMVMIRHR